MYSFFKVFRGKKAAGFQSTGLHYSILFPFLENLFLQENAENLSFQQFLVNSIKL